MARMFAFRPRRPTRRRQGGFSLLEVLLAVTVAMVLSALQLNQLRQNTEYAQADAVGQQLKTVGSALNSYITLRYTQLSALTSVTAPGTASDPGPRTCNAATGICVVTAQTLVASGLLPENFSNVNAFGANYLYYILVQGTAPNWQISGLVVTSNPYMVGVTPRFDLIGQAMTTAGADSGATFTAPNRVDGYAGAWKSTAFAAAPGYPNLLGLMAYQVGYGSWNSSQYMLLSGATPMEGDLNMYDGQTYHNIVGANNVTANGTVTGGSFVTQSPNAAAITLNAGTPANETILGNNGSAMTVVNGGGVQFVNSTGQGTPLLAGSATIGTLTSSSTGSFGGALTGASLTTTSGNVSSSAVVQANTSITAVGSIFTQNGNITSNGNVTAGGSGSFGTMVVGTGGTTGTFAPNNWTMANGGGWIMTDTTTMNVVGNKNIDTAGTIEGGTLKTDQDAQVARFVVMNGAQAAGTSCTTGDFARDLNGRVLQCVSGTWVTASYSNVSAVASAQGTNVTAACPAGSTLVSGGYNLVYRPTVNDHFAPGISHPSGNGWNVQAGSGSNSQFTAVAYCAQ